MVLNYQLLQAGKRLDLAVETFAGPGEAGTASDIVHTNDTFHAVKTEIAYSLAVIRGCESD